MTFEIEANKFHSTPFIICEVELDSGTQYFGKIDIESASALYEGYISRFGHLSRSVSHKDASFEISSVNISFINNSQHFSKNFDPRLLINRTVIFKVGFETITLAEFRTFYTGIITDFTYSDKKFTLNVKDKTQKYLEKKDYMAVILSDDWPDASNIGSRMPLIYGDVSLAGKGACNLIKLDNVGKYLVAGHACVGVDSVYVDGVLQTLTTHYTLDTSEAFTGGILDLICTVTFTSGNIPDSYDTISANVQGIDYDTDGTGILIENPADQLLHFIEDVVVIPAALIDSSAFVTASDVADDRNYIGAGIVNTEKTVKTVISEICFSILATPYHTNEGKLAVNIFNVTLAGITEAVKYSDQNSILQGSFKQTVDVNNIVNDITVSYKYDYTNGEYALTASGSDENAITDDLKTYDRSLNFDWIRDTATVNDIIQRYLLRYSYPVINVNFKAPLVALTNDLADFIKVTHFAGTGSSGFDGRLFEIIRLDPNMDNLSVSVTGIDSQTWVQHGFFLGDGAVIEDDWGNASDSDKLYGYLADETTEQFTNGESIKRIY